jgi:hypothetical protein
VFALTGLDRVFELFATVEEALAALAPPARDHLVLSADAALALGLVATAIPFADSRAAEAERWLRVLRLHGDAGRVLTPLGLGEAPLFPIVPSVPDEADDQPVDAVAGVTEYATRLAIERGSGTVGTADLLAGVMTVYGADFDRVLEAHGSSRRELIDHLDVNGWKLTDG